MHKKIVGVYKVTSPSGKIYIGQSWDIGNRKSTYKTAPQKAQTKLFNSLQKYSWEQHQFEIIHVLPSDINQEVLDTYELLYWDLYKNCGIEMLNLKVPGKGGKHSAETIKKLKERCYWNGKSGDKHTVYGRKHTEKDLELMSRKVIDSSTGEIHRSITLAASKNNLSYSTLYSYLNGSRKNKTSLKFL